MLKRTASIAAVLLGVAVSTRPVPAAEAPGRPAGAVATLDVTGYEPAGARPDGSGTFTFTVQVSGMAAGWEATGAKVYCANVPVQFNPFGAPLKPGAVHLLAGLPFEAGSTSMTWTAPFQLADLRSKVAVVEGGPGIHFAATVTLKYGSQGTAANSANVVLTFNPRPPDSSPLQPEGTTETTATFSCLEPADTVDVVPLGPVLGDISAVRIVYSTTGPIVTEGDFDGAAPARAEFGLSGRGKPMSIRVVDLFPGTTYWFSARFGDAAVSPQWSGMSPGVMAGTLEGSPSDGDASTAAAGACGLGTPGDPCRLSLIAAVLGILIASRR